MMMMTKSRTVVKGTRDEITDAAREEHLELSVRI
uniref:Uncharacterized protein n=1 Tax=Parascaris univalens TaxID=6257 RepID=A0A915A4U4_PARUN